MDNFSQTDAETDSVYTTASSSQSTLVVGIKSIRQTDNRDSHQSQGQHQEELTRPGQETQRETSKGDKIGQDSQKEKHHVEETQQSETIEGDEGTEVDERATERDSDSGNEEREEEEEEEEGQENEECWVVED
ncbi:hypothetical protein BGX27_005968, partial [Mortierella sp. AM989]